jgi:hypothetical protein
MFAFWYSAACLFDFFFSVQTFSSSSHMNINQIFDISRKYFFLKWKFKKKSNKKEKNPLAKKEVSFVNSLCAWPVCCSFACAIIYFVVLNLKAKKKNKKQINLKKINNWRNREEKTVTNF